MPYFYILSFSLLLYGVVRISYSIWWKPKWLERQLKQQGIRGTPYKLLVGDIPELVKQMKAAWSKPISLHHNIVPRISPFSLNNVQKYGKISMFWPGKTPRLIIKDPEMMKEVLSNKQGHFGKPPLNTLVLILTRGLTTLEGETWTKRRRVLNPAFHTQKIKGMIPGFSISCNLMIERWKKMTSDNETGELDIWPELQKLTADIILRAAFGSSYEEGKKMSGLQKELITLVIEAMQTIYIPGFRCTSYQFSNNSIKNRNSKLSFYRFLPTKNNPKRNKLVKEITSIMKDLIQRRQNAIRSEQSKVDDILSLLLQRTEENSMTQNTNGTKSAEITIEEVTMILYEVLRLYPPAIAIYICIPTSRPRLETSPSQQEFDLNLPILLIHHDPKLWGDDAEEFKPERFSEGVSNASKDQLAFFPFGWGPN
ncbi:cytochrome P450 72A15-like isoform X2 [Tripterygium wilfordii]|uniref:Cytochrome P450 72A15-like isoform X2 n=1 Tax=Tripterygium wilfordii TaxID=458696 RepID=A0A7J7BWN2_TRIWF|nr:cytochrome P450 72A15-like isoform X2 [Tripterygium wilfordii]